MVNEPYLDYSLGMCVVAMSGTQLVDLFMHVYMYCVCVRVLH